MSQMTENQGNTANQKEYHRPKLHKFGSVSELTLALPRPATGADGGSGLSQYAS